MLELKDITIHIVHRGCNGLMSPDDWHEVYSKQHSMECCCTIWQCEACGFRKNTCDIKRDDKHLFIDAGRYLTKASEEFKKLDGK